MLRVEQTEQREKREREGAYHTIGCRELAKHQMVLQSASITVVEASSVSYNTRLGKP